METGYGETTRVIQQDGPSGSGESSAMPMGPNTVFASDANIAAADALRDAQIAAQEKKEGTTIRVGDGARRITEHSDGRTTVEASRDTRRFRNWRCPR